MPFRSFGAGIWANERLVMVPKKVLFCRLYLAATSGVCLIRSGAAGFQKKTTFAQRSPLYQVRLYLGGANPGVIGVRGVGARF
jgi:hypothetical protein